MTHIIYVVFCLPTRSSDDGVGDLGQEGITAFEEQHECREICNALGLSPANGATSSFPDLDDDTLDDPDHPVSAREEVGDSDMGNGVQPEDEIQVPESLSLARQELDDEHEHAPNMQQPKAPDLEKDNEDYEEPQSD